MGPYPVDPRAPAGQPPLPGGVDAVVLALADGLARRPGIEVSVITAVSGLTAPVRVDGGRFPVYCVPRPRGGRLTGQRAVIGCLCQQITASAPDIVHAHIAGIYGRAALLSQRPAVLTLHGVIYREMRQAWPTSNWPARLRWLSDALLERAVVRRAPEIIAISPYIVAEFRRQTGARFHMVENPVDDRFFIADALPLCRQRLLYVGRVIPRKGILALLHAFGQIAQARPAATLTLVGEMTTDPGYTARCHTLVSELGVADRVRFAGALPPAAVLQEYAASDLVLLASEQETAPVSIAEAMAAGRAVVATDVGGCAAMVADGVTGRIVPARDPGALAAAVSGLLAEPERLAQMGLAARAAAEARFRRDAVVEATLAVYRQILEGRT